MKKLLLITAGLATGFGAFAQTIVSTTPTNKNVVLEELTGKTCQYCPDGHKIAAQIHANNPGRVMLLNIHTGGYAAGTPNYRTTWGDYVGGLFSVSGYPTGAVNRTDYGAGVMHSRSQWTANSNTTLGQSSPVNVGGAATIDLDTRQLTLDVEAYYTAAGPGSSNKMNVVITQNNIAGPQTGGSTWNPAQILPNGQYNHMHMVRHTLTPNAGDNIASISATSLYTNNYSYSIPATINSIPVNLADLEIAVYVSEGTSTGKVISGDYADITFVTATPLGAANGAASIDASLGAVCGTTVDGTMQITNMGNTPLSTATIEYTVNGGTPGSYQHTFSSPLATGDYEVVTIPAIPGLTSGGATSTIDFDVTMLNGTPNPGTNTSNGHTVATATTKSSNTTTVSFTITTDDWGSETTWSLVNESTTGTILSGGPYTNVAGGQTFGPFNGILVDGDCYKFQINDSYGDGICCAEGNGSYSLTAGATVLSAGGSFTTVDGDKFVFDETVGIDEVVNENSFSIFPNPTNSVSTITFDLTETTLVKMEVFNAMGSLVQTNGTNSMNAGTQKLTFDGTELPNGIYFVNVVIGEQVITKKVSLLK
jgi:hypothetical protein